MEHTHAGNLVIYHDKLLWYIAYPLFSISFLFFANGNPIPVLLQMPSFYTDLLFSSAICLLVFLYLKKTTIRLDKKTSWIEAFSLRLWLQMLFGVLLPLGVSMTLEVVYLILIDVPLASSSILTLELPLSFLLLLLINAYYLIDFLLNFKKSEESIAIDEDKKLATCTIEEIMVQKGFREVKLALVDCAHLYKSNKVIWLNTFSGEQYRLGGTLEEWEEKLCGSNFHRLNRQCIASRKSISSVEQTETRKLKINLIPSTLEEDIFVSKPNAASFKLWWRNEGPS